jgi:hypothetical protein
MNPSVLATRMVLGAACAVSVLIGGGLPSSTAAAQPVAQGRGGSTTTMAAPHLRPTPSPSSGPVHVSAQSPNTHPLLGALQSSAASAETAETIDYSAVALRAGTEMSMIELQSMMAQRGMALQMAVGIAQAVGTPTKDMAQNIGR